MLIAGGNSGVIKDVQGKVASARKVFRVMKVSAMPCALCSLQPRLIIMCCTHHAHSVAQQPM
jgi:hypothetical protein